MWRKAKENDYCAAFSSFCPCMCTGAVWKRETVTYKVDLMNLTVVVVFVLFVVLFVVLATLDPDVSSPNQHAPPYRTSHIVFHYYPLRISL